MAQDDAFKFGLKSYASFYVHNFAMIAFKKSIVRLAVFVYDYWVRSLSSFCCWFSVVYVVAQTARGTREQLYTFCI